MNDGRYPEMSVVLATPDRYDTIRKTISCLRKQTVQYQLEVVIVVLSAEDLRLDEAELASFFGFTIVEVGAVKSIASANAAGIRNATAPIVAFAEDHAFPDRNWAEAMIKAHRGNWAAVGPVVRNENPGSAISCADFLIGYGVWQEGSSRGVVQHLPGHNSSYKRSVLIDYGADLETMLEAESVLHWDLNRRGYRLYLEPRAQISHLNFGVISSWLRAQYHSGRMFAAIRSRKWSRAKRLLYTCSAPLIPAIRFCRIFRQIYQHRPKLQLRVLPMLILGLSVSAFGEMAGYGVGEGDSRKNLACLEFHRIRHIGCRPTLLKSAE